ncbi:unnamed protein product [Phytomonas sp. Hart1]|nr:unnamed protein product [Phytomonas sp. Hart1]|eukprot:CCW70719.1 unnamed protein product [Phytomonas sp. isolate Hart1]
MDFNIPCLPSAPTATASLSPLTTNDDDGILQLLQSLEDHLDSSEKSLQQTMQDYTKDLLRLRHGLRWDESLRAPSFPPPSTALAATSTDGLGVGSGGWMEGQSPAEAPVMAFSAARARSRARTAVYRRQAAIARVEYRLGELWGRYVEPWFRECVYAGFFLRAIRRLRELTRRVERAHERLRGRYTFRGVLERGVLSDRPPQEPGTPATCVGMEVGDEAGEGNAPNASGQPTEDFPPPRDPQWGLGLPVVRRSLSEVLPLLLRVLPETAAALEEGAARRYVLFFQVLLPAALTRDEEAPSTAAAVQSLLAWPLHALRRLLRSSSENSDGLGDISLADAADGGLCQLLALSFLVWKSAQAGQGALDSSHSLSPEPPPSQCALLVLLRYLGGLHAHLQYCRTIASSLLALNQEWAGLSLSVEREGDNCVSTTNACLPHAEELLDNSSWHMWWGATPEPSSSVPPSWDELLRKVKDMAVVATPTTPEEEEGEEEEMKRLKEAFDVCCFAWMQTLQSAKHIIGLNNDSDQRCMHDGKKSFTTCDPELGSMQMEIRMLYEWERTIQRAFQNAEMMWQDITHQS